MNQFIRHFRRNPVPYIIGLIVLIVLLPFVLRMGLSLLSMALSVAGGALGAMLVAIGALLRLFWWVFILALVVWAVVALSRGGKAKGKAKRSTLEDVAQRRYYDDYGDEYVYEDEYFARQKARGDHPGDRP